MDISETKEAVFQALQEVFGDTQEDPKQMKILVKRVPILCTTVELMHVDIAQLQKDVGKINDNLTWGIRLVLGAVILGVLALLFK